MKLHVCNSNKLNHISSEFSYLMHYTRGATEQSTLSERGEFHENSAQFLGSSARVYITTYRTGYIF